MTKGKIIQIIGSVVDVEFPEEGKLPALFNALKVKRLSFGMAQDKHGEVTLEVVKHLDLTKIRAISLQSTDGLERGLEVNGSDKTRIRRF